MSTLGAMADLGCACWNALLGITVLPALTWTPTFIICSFKLWGGEMRVSLGTWPGLDRAVSAGDYRAASPDLGCLLY